jgi:hypothetical protein
MGGIIQPSLVIDATQIEPADVDPHGIFPPTVMLDNEPLSDGASKDDVCGGSRFVCTWRSSHSHPRMEMQTSPC